MTSDRVKKFCNPYHVIRDQLVRRLTSYGLRFALLIAALPLLILLAPRSAQASLNTITVGSGTACDYVRIQDAIDAAPFVGADTIQVEAKTFFENLDVDSDTLDLLGGYDSKCNGARTTAKTVVDASNNDTVLVVRNAAVVVDQFELTNGNDRFDTDGGGVYATSSSFLRLRNTFITYSEAIQGGGLYNDGSNVVIEDGSVIHSNTADLSGGGIYCKRNSIDGNGYVIVSGGSQIGLRVLTSTFPNVAANSGGGIYNAGCNFSVWDATVTSNEAKFGGGVSSREGEFELSQGGQIINNMATEFGGGVSVTIGRFDFERGRISNNIAGGNGGGVHLSGATLTTGRDGCQNVVDCIVISGNQALNGGAVSAINSTITLSQAQLLDNVATAEGGAVYSEISGSGLNNRLLTHLSVRHSILSGNQSSGQYTIYNSNGPVSSLTRKVRIFGNTFAENVATGGSLVELRLEGVAQDVTFNGNFVGGSDSDGVVSFAALASLDVRCNYVPVGSNSAFAGGDNRQLVTAANWDASFTDAAGGDFRPKPTSPLIDACVSYNTDAFDFFDIDHLDQTRGFDLLAVANGGATATWDIGAFELSGSVGLNGAACSFPTITAAIEAASPGDTVYIGGTSAETVYGENLVIDDTLTLVRASGDCTAIATNATDTTEQKVVIDGSVTRGAGSTIAVGGGVTLTLQSLVVRNGFGINGGSIAGALNSTIVLSETVVSNGLATGTGGGVATDGALIVQHNSRIESSLAGGDGGGVAITNAAGRLDIRSGGIISDNVAQGNGGGIALVRDAVMTVDGGTIAANRATDDGGGVYADRTTLILTDMLLADNEADEGGGIYATLPDVTLTNGRVEGNSAETGGGIFGLGTGLITIGSDFTTCDPEALGFDRYCSEFTTNEAQSGGGIFVFGTDLVVDSTAMLGNRGNGSNPNGAALAVESNGQTTLTNVLWTANGQAASVVELAGTFAATFEFNTFGLNTTAPIRAQNGTTFNFINSVEWSNSDPIINSGSAPATLTCSNFQPFNNGGSAVLGVDPQFANRGHSFFQLATDSPAIDQCTSNVTTDILGHQRTFGVAADRGVFEIGSDAVPTAVQMREQMTMVRLHEFVVTGLLMLPLLTASVVWLRRPCLASSTLQP